MSNPLHLLILEDRPSDAELMVAELRHNGYDLTWQRVENETQFLQALKDDFDLILADYALPQYDALTALKALQKTGREIPMIIVTGSVSEEIAVECMKQGAADYLLKDRLTRLGPAAAYALHQKQLEKEKNTTEIALEASEALNRAVLNSINAHIAVLDRQGNIIVVNEAWERFARVNGDQDSRHTGVGQNYLAVCRQAVENGATEVLPILEGIEAVLSGEQNLYSCEYPAHSTWLKRWFSLYVTPLPAPHHGAVVTHVEITDRKMAEDQLRLQSAALEAAPNAMIISGKDGRIVWVNPAFTNLTGYSYTEAVGRPSRLGNPGANNSATYRQMWNTLQSGETWKSEILNRRKDGSVYTGEITIAPVRDENGETSHYIDIEQDITERKQHERELEAIVVVANALRNAKTRAEMLPVILDQLIDLLMAEGASISLYDPATDEMVVNLARGPFAGSSGIRYNAREGLTGVVVNSRRIYLSQNVTSETGLNDIPAGHPYAVAGVPLITQEQLVGVIWMVRSAEVNSTEARLLTAIADIAASAIYRASLYEETELRLQRLTALREIDKAITTSLDLRVTLSVLIDQVISQLSVDAAEVLLLTHETQSLEYAVGVGFRHVFPRTTRLISLNYANRAVLERRIISIPNISDEDGDLLEKMRSRGEDFIAYFAVPLISKGQVKGVLELFKRNPTYPNPEWLNFLEMTAGQAAIAIDNAELFENLQRSNINLAMAYDDTIEGWSRTLELRDQETEGHTQRVTEMTVRLACAYGIPENELVHIRRGSLLHDIGKMGIPDNILLKPGALNPDEWEVIRRHPVYAYELLSPIEFLHPALDIPYCHHERWDGSGYPRGLKGEQIPTAARIFSIIDVYDALISNRPYREGWHRERVLDYIKGQSGTQFDPAIVEIFMTMINSE